MNCWKSISELRDVVNVLKHSEGKSEEHLRKNRPDFFLINGKDCLRIYHTTLGEVVLNIKMKLWSPSEYGSMDPRQLGIPLRTIEFAENF